VHVHRIGRTGRAGSKGSAYSLVGKDEAFRLTRLKEQFGIEARPEPLPPDYLLDKPAYKPAMATLLIDGGKKQKVRPGDILGALTGESGIAGTDVGKIDIFDNHSYVAVRRDVATAALAKLTDDKVKGRSFRVRRLGS
jgi:ATP-independent RNA helicase DbpA